MSESCQLNIYILAYPLIWRSYPKFWIQKQPDINCLRLYLPLPELTSECIDNRGVTSQQYRRLFQCFFITCFLIPSIPFVFFVPDYMFYSLLFRHLNSIVSTEIIDKNHIVHNIEWNFCICFLKCHRCIVCWQNNNYFISIVHLLFYHQCKKKKMFQI